MLKPSPLLSDELLLQYCTVGCKPFVLPKVSNEQPDAIEGYLVIDKKLLGDVFRDSKNTSDFGYCAVSLPNGVAPLCDNRMCFPHCSLIERNGLIKKDSIIILNNTANRVLGIVPRTCVENITLLGSLEYSLLASYPKGAIDPIPGRGHAILCNKEVHRLADIRSNRESHRDRISLLDSIWLECTPYDDEKLFPQYLHDLLYACDEYEMGGSLTSHNQMEEDFIGESQVMHTMDSQTLEELVTTKLVDPTGDVGQRLITERYRR